MGYFCIVQPDGSRIVTTADDNTAVVWDAATGESLAELKGHTWSFSSASFSLDGSRIVTSSTAKTARLWDSIPYRIRYMERMAAGVDGAAASEAVDSLYASLGDWTRAADAVRQDQAMTDEIRRRALGIITVRAEEQRREDARNP